VAIDLCTNGIFIIDILIVFNTAYYDKEGEEITNHGLIAKKYLSGMFLIDLHSSIPFTYLIPSVPQMRLFGMLKVVRIRRITKIVNKLQVEEEVKAVSSNRKFSTRRLLSIHFAANQNFQVARHALLHHEHHCVHMVLDHQCRPDVGATSRLLLRWLPPDSAIL